MSASRVAVVIPVYNGARTIRRAIESALNQQSITPDVIVVDDGSTDQTPQILTGYGDRIRVIRQRNRGPSAARNAGAAASGASEYISFLDADDAWLPRMLATTIPSLDAAPSSALVFSDVVPVDDEGHALDICFIDDWFAHAPSLEELLTTWWPIFPSAAVMRRDAFLRCGGFNDEFTAPGFEDPYLWLRMRERGEFEYVDEPMAMYRVTPPLERMLKYAAGYRIYTRLVEDRYGSAGESVLKALSMKFVDAWTYEAHKGLLAGDRLRARNAFRCALQYGPSRFRYRATSRWLRTFLPLPMVRALSGKSLRKTKLQDEWEYFFERPPRILFG